MPAYWDFRSVLDVCPDASHFTCVGTTQKGTRCGQRMFSRSDLSQASRILDEMDACKKLSSSYKHLEELAELTLCPRWHRKPGRNQAKSMIVQWKRQIVEYQAKVERKQKATARAAAQQALSEWKNKVAEIELDLEEEVVSHKVVFANFAPTYTKIDKIQTTTIVKSAANMSSTSTLQMPKVTLEPTPPPSCSTTPSKPSKENTAVRADFRHLEVESKPAKAEDCTPVTPKKEIKPEVPLETLKVTEVTSLNSAAITQFSNGALRTLSEEKTKIATFNFAFPPTPDATPEPQTKQERKRQPLFESGTGKESPFPKFYLGKVDTLPPSLPVAAPPSFNIAAHHIQTNVDVHGLKSDLTHKLPSRSFDFSTPMQLPSYVEDPFVSKPEIPFPPSLSIPKAAPATKYGLVTPEATPERAQTSIVVREESYGYATVTSASTRYKSGLTSQRQHDLPAPEKCRGQHQDEFEAFISDSPSSVAAVLRKPLPLLPTPQSHDRCTRGCGASDSGRECGCSENLTNESVKVGCFHSSRLTKLRKKVIRKMNALKAKTVEALSRQSHTSRAN